MSKNQLDEDSPVPKFIHLMIRRWDGIKSLTTLEEGEFKMPIDTCIRTHVNCIFCKRKICREHKIENYQTERSIAAMFLHSKLLFIKSYNTKYHFV